VSAEPIPVEILHTPDCGRWQAARDALRRLSEESGLPIVLSETTVSTSAEARALRFPGSPTVRVAGRDLEPEAEKDVNFGLG